MKEESRNQRLKNLTNLGKVLNAWHFVYAIIFLTFFPYLTKGTAIYEDVVMFSRYGTLGILIAPFYLRWIRIIFGWYVKTGRTIESPTLVPLLLVGALIGASISYIMLRIFKHDGDWGMTLTISHEDAIFSLYSNILIALSAGLITMITLYYREGYNILFKSDKSTPFWKYLATLFFVPFLLVLMILYASL